MVMNPELYQAIEKAVADGVPPTMLASTLSTAGWPVEMVNQAIETWMSARGANIKVTGFKEWVKKYQLRARPAIAVVVFLGMIDAAIALLKPLPLKILADSAFGNHPAPGLLKPYTHTPKLIFITSLMTIFLFVLGATFNFFSDFLLLKIGFWLNKMIKGESLRHILHLPLFHQERLAKGDYVYRQNVVTNSLSDLVLGTTSSIISSIIMIIAVLVIMLKFNPMLTLVSVVLMPLLYLTMRIFGPRMGKYAQRLNEVASETASKINESVDNAETIQAFTLEDKQLGRIDRLWNNGYFLTKKSMLWSNLLANTNSFLVVVATAIVMYFGGSAALQGRMTFGDLLIFMTYMGYLLGPIEGLVKQVTSRNQKIIDVRRVYEVLSDHEGIEDLRKDRAMAPAIKGEIDFRNVSYAYNGQVIFNDLNLHINQAEKIGIIGPSGGGKSTILRLLPLFLVPDRGQVMIDGVDTQTVSLKELRKHIAWVSQVPQLFTGSILDNLLDGDVHRPVANEELANAIMVSNVAEFAIRLPLGVLTPTGENGSSLSGGQRQRIAIARSLIKNAPILCLDEPTAALDVKSENYIRDSLLQMVQGKTVVMVTHRKALLALMDKIYVLDNGTLTDVNQMGGLDYYLGMLEGIEQDVAQKQINAEQQEINPEVMESFLGLIQSMQQSVPASDNADIGQPPAPGTPIVNEAGEVEIKLH